MPAARLTEVGTDAAPGCLPPTVVMLTMAPPPAARRWGMARTSAADGTVDLELQISFPGRVVHVLEWLRGRSAGIVDEDVQPAETPRRRIHEVVRLLGVGHVERQRLDTASGGRADFLGSQLKRSLAPGADDHVAALGGQGGRDGPADAFAAAGDGGGESGQPQVHVGR